MLASAGGSRQSTIAEIGAFRDDKQHGTPGAIWTQPAAAPAVLVGCWLTNRQSGRTWIIQFALQNTSPGLREPGLRETWFAGSLRLELPQTMLADGSRSLVMTNVIWGRPGMNTSGHQLKVGLFGIGLDTYWPQFPGLQDRLIG